MDAPCDIRLILSDQFRLALGTLLTAYDYAQDSGADRWQFAIDLSDLFARGATLSDIRWLIHRGLAEHAKETTTPGEQSRSFRPLSATSFPPDACLTITPTGAQSLRPLLHGREASAPDPPQSGTSPDPWPLTPSPYPSSPGPSPSAPDPLPCWDPLHRELRYAGQVIKRYRVPAPNQELILTAFQEEDWPEFLDDPLPPVAELDPKHRVKITIKSLNRNQVSPLIRFHGCKIVGTVRFAPPLVDNYCFRASRRVHNRTVCVENKGCSDWHSPLRPLSEQIHESLATLVVIG